MMFVVWLLYGGIFLCIMVSFKLNCFFRFGIILFLMKEIFFIEYDMYVLYLNFFLEVSGSFW